MIFKTFKKIFLIGLTLFIIACGENNQTNQNESKQEYTEGVDFITLEQEIADSKNTLIKVFSYDCIFCYKYDTEILPKVLVEIPDITFIPYHLSTKAEFGNEASELFATLVIQDENDKITNLFSEDSTFKKAKSALYKAYHEDKERWHNDKSEDNRDKEAFLNTALAAINLPKDEYNKLKQDKKVQDLLKKWDKAYDIASIQGGVPTFVVNGKYIVLLQNIKSEQQMIDLIKWLSSK